MKCNYCGSEIPNSSAICSVCGSAVSNPNLTSLKKESYANAVSPTDSPAVTQQADIVPQLGHDGRPLIRLAPNLSRKDFCKMEHLKKAVTPIVAECVLMVLSAISGFAVSSYFSLLFIAAAVALGITKDVKVAVGSMIVFAINSICNFMAGIWVGGLISIIAAALALHSTIKLDNYWKQYQSDGTIPDLTVKAQK